MLSVKALLTHAITALMLYHCSRARLGELVENRWRGASRQTPRLRERVTVTTAHSLRQRIREELRLKIIETAREQMGTRGANELSLRAIARELGMASSAVYRYFPSRDDLLTALIIDGYTAIGETVEAADARAPRDAYLDRWLAVCRALREWALANPHVYALVYGSPIPGYQAPAGTVEPATRDKIVYGRIVSDAYRAGALRLPQEQLTADLTPLADDTARLRQAVLPDVPDAVAVAALTAWAGLFGMLGLELFGHFNQVIENRSAMFDEAITNLGRMMGLSTES